MVTLGLGKRIGCSMKLRKFVIACFVSLMYLSLCGNACSPELVLYDCGMIINVEKPREADSIHVSVYNVHDDGSVYYFYTNYGKSTTCTEWDVYFEAKSEDLEKMLGWKYGEFFMQETVFCKYGKTVFPPVSFDMKKGGGRYVDVSYQSGGNYKTFSPLENACNIDSMYKIQVHNIFFSCED